MNIVNIEIFGKIIYGSDAELWLKLCKQEKKDWILKNTNQKNEVLIDEFINNPSISKNCKCVNCGKNVNISKTDVNEIATVSEVVKPPRNSRRTNSQRRNQS